MDKLHPLQWLSRGLKPLLFLACLLPLLLLLWDAFHHSLGANPVEEIIHRTGLWALRLLLLTLAITPLRRLTGWNQLIRLRRMLGLYSFFYALLHFLAYGWLEHTFRLPLILQDVVEHPYVALGFSSFLLLVPLAATSTNRMIRLLGGRRWQRLHRLVYLCALGATLHYLWLVKVDTRAPLLYLALLALLLVARMPLFRSGAPVSRIFQRAGK